MPMLGPFELLILIVGLLVLLVFPQVLLLLIPLLLFALFGVMM